MKYRIAIFDLDGTITDSGAGIMNSIRYAMKKRGLPELPEEELKGFIGPPLKEQFQFIFGLTEEESVQMTEDYREYYSEKGIFENKVYDGVPEMLERLSASGVRVLMATAKPEYYAGIIADHFDFAKYFEFIGGACMDGSRTDKHEVIEYVLEKYGVSCKDRESTVMVGDRSNDMIGAENSGIHSIGVLYGYGSREELERAGARALAETPGIVADLISGIRAG